MRRNGLVVTALLMLPFTTSAAAAEETTEQRSKRAQKIINTLKMFGIANPQLNKLVTEAESHVEDDGYFYIADHKNDDGRLALRFECKGAPQIKRLQLSYTPTDTNYEVTATTKGVMFRYHYEFK